MRLGQTALLLLVAALALAQEKVDQPSFRSGVELVQLDVAVQAGSNVQKCTRFSQQFLYFGELRRATRRRWSVRRPAVARLVLRGSRADTLSTAARRVWPRAQGGGEWRSRGGSSAKG